MIDDDTLRAHQRAEMDRLEAELAARMRATSCPACDDDGGPCVLCGRPEIPVLAPRPLAEGSWLHGPDYEWFRRGLAYAGTQTRAIPALSAVAPEDLYHAVWAIMRGAGLPDPEDAALRAEASGEITDADRVRAGLLRCYCGIPVSRGVSVSGWYETDGELHICPLVRRAARWSEREGHV